MTTPPPDYFPALLQQLQQADDATARALLEQAASEHPRDPRPLLLMAGGLASSGNYDAAEGAYTLALQRAPDFALARFQLGLLQLTGARPGAAFATWAPLERLPDADPLRLFKRAFEALAADRVDEARDLFAKGIDENKANEPLNRDMRMVIERIEKLRSPPGDAPGTPGPTATSEPGGASHFLVSTYSGKN